VTTKLMKEHFADIVNVQFTADMEVELDNVEEGSRSMNDVLYKFWGGFEKELKAAEGMITEAVEIPPEQADMVCDKCGSQMIVRNGRFGKFAACPNYPTCKNTKPLGKEPAATAEKPGDEKPVVLADFKCDKCGGDMVLRSGRYGSFYACANFPTCKNTRPWAKEINVPCPKCGSKIMMKSVKSKTVFYSCEKYPDCDFSSWDLPTNESCPTCGGMLFRKKGKPLLICRAEGCRYERELEETGTEQEES
jgi:DNA topoisomerase-1